MSHITPIVAVPAWDETGALFNARIAELNRAKADTAARLTRILSRELVLRLDLARYFRAKGMDMAEATNGITIELLRVELTGAQHPSAAKALELYEQRKQDEGEDDACEASPV
ncbi:MAG TPA: hypothetical protein VH253_06335 [Phycisphaerae bacterium]|nr:hypothetical protein [Phycisphaerae bacterium]